MQNDAFHIDSAGHLVETNFEGDSHRVTFYGGRPGEIARIRRTERPNRDLSVGLFDYLNRPALGR